MSSTLQDLRKEAGFRTAKDFAEAVGIPAPTYTRYEQDPLKIPVDRAWKIADELHCSIDAVVGRKHIDVADMRSDFQKYYDSLSKDSQEILDLIAAVLKGRDNSKKKQHQDEEDRRFDQYAIYYERLFEQEADKNAELGDVIVFGSPRERRAAFERYLNDRAAKKRAEKVEAECAPKENEIELNATSIMSLDGSEEISCDDPRFGQKLQEMFDSIREDTEAEYAEEDKVEIAKLMAAYDRLHPRRSSFSEAARNVRNALVHSGSVRLSNLDSETIDQGRQVIDFILSHSGDVTPSANPRPESQL